MLEGFTVTGGTGEPATGSFRNLRGGGAYVFRSEPVLRNDVFVSNRAGADGGGIFVSDPRFNEGILVDRCAVRGNWADEDGGGIWIEAVVGTVRGCRIVDNVTGELDGAGIGIFMVSPGEFLVESNLILGNRAANEGGGIWVTLHAGNAIVVIQGNVIAHNRADGTWPWTSSRVGGGGIFVAGAMQFIRHNTIVFNESAGRPSAMGGGIGVASGKPVIERNILAYATSGGGVHCEPEGSPLLQDNLAWSNREHGTWNCLGWEQTNGNVVADPLICDPSAGDFTVARISPALTHPSGPVGAYPDPGCEEVPVQPTAWGRIKLRHP